MKAATKILVFPFCVSLSWMCACTTSNTSSVQMRMLLMLITLLFTTVNNLASDAMVTVFGLFRHSPNLLQKKLSINLAVAFLPGFLPMRASERAIPSRSL